MIAHCKSASYDTKFHFQALKRVSRINNSPPQIRDYGEAVQHRISTNPLCPYQTSNRHRGFAPPRHGHNIWISDLNVVVDITIAFLRSPHLQSVGTLSWHRTCNTPHQTGHFAVWYLTSEREYEEYCTENAWIKDGLVHPPYYAGTPDPPYSSPAVLPVLEPTSWQRDPTLRLWYLWEIPIYQSPKGLCFDQYLNKLIFFPNTRIVIWLVFLVFLEYNIAFLSCPLSFKHVTPFFHGVLMTLCCPSNSRMLRRYLFLGSLFLERILDNLSHRHIVLLLHNLSWT